MAVVTAVDRFSVERIVKLCERVDLFCELIFTGESSDDFSSHSGIVVSTETSKSDPRQTKFGTITRISCGETVVKQPVDENSSLNGS